MGFYLMALAAKNADARKRFRLDEHSGFISNWGIVAESFDAGTDKISADLIFTDKYRNTNTFKQMLSKFNVEQCSNNSHKKLEYIPCEIRHGMNVSFNLWNKKEYTYGPNSYRLRFKDISPSLLNKIESAFQASKVYDEYVIYYRSDDERINGPFQFGGTMHIYDSTGNLYTDIKADNSPDSIGVMQRRTVYDYDSTTGLINEIRYLDDEFRQIISLDKLTKDEIKGFLSKLKAKETGYFRYLLKAALYLKEGKLNKTLRFLNKAIKERRKMQKKERLNKLAEMSVNNPGLSAMIIQYKLREAVKDYTVIREIADDIIRFYPYIETGYRMGMEAGRVLEAGYLTEQYEDMMKKINEQKQLPTAEGR